MKNKEMNLRRDNFSNWFFQVYKANKIKHLAMKRELRLIQDGFYNYRKAVATSKMVKRHHEQTHRRLIELSFVSLKQNVRLNHEEREMTKIANQFFTNKMYRAFFVSLKGLFGKMKYGPVVFEQKVMVTARALRDKMLHRVFREWRDLHVNKLKRQLYLTRDCKRIRNRGVFLFFVNTIKRHKRAVSERVNIHFFNSQLGMLGRCFDKWSGDFVVFSRKERKLQARGNFCAVQTVFMKWKYHMEKIAVTNKKLEFCLMKKRKALARRVLGKLKSRVMMSKKLREKGATLTKVVNGKLICKQTSVWRAFLKKKLFFQKQVTFKKIFN
jgi:hypothetical protein